MRLPKLALYLDTGKCPVSDKSAGHTGRKGTCEACESHLDAEGVRERVEERLETTQALDLPADAKGWEIAAAREGEDEPKPTRKSNRTKAKGGSRKPAAAAAKVITGAQAARMNKQALVEFVQEGGSIEG